MTNTRHLRGGRTVTTMSLLGSTMSYQHIGTLGRLDPLSNLLWNHNYGLQNHSPSLPFFNIQVPQPGQDATDCPPSVRRHKVQAPPSHPHHPSQKLPPGWSLINPPPPSQGLPDSFSVLKRKQKQSVPCAQTDARLSRPSHRALPFLSGSAWGQED